MPTYPYLCSEHCGEIEIFHGIKEPARKKCPDCGGPVVRLIGGGCGIVMDGDRLWDAAPTPNNPRAEKKSDLKRDEAYLIGVPPPLREKYRRLHFSDNRKDKPNAMP